MASIKGSPTTKNIEEMQIFYDKGNSLRKVQKQFDWSTTTLLKILKTRQPKIISDEDRKRRAINRVVSWRKRVKIRLVEYKGGRCQGCGYNRYVGALDFHHRDPKKKKFRNNRQNNCI